MHSVDTECGAEIRSRLWRVGTTLQLRKLTTATLPGALTKAVLFATLLMAGRVAHAQTEAVLHSFSGTPDGAQPTSSLALNGGNLYGTTYDGGLGYGTVYEVSPNGSGGWTETTVYSFCQLAACADGENPTYSSLVFDGQGNLYGTAYGGGANGYGVVFELSNSNGTWTESVLHSFANAPNDAANPGSGVIMDGAGNLFGVAFAGGTGNGKGCVFELSPSNGTWTAQVIYDMNSTHTGLTLSLPSTPEVIYGATYTTVFELTPNGTGGWTETALFTFTAADSATEGAEPVGTLALDPSGNLYGATEAGGTNNKGVVYKLTPAATGNWTETVLFSFGGEGQYGPNGATPFAGVILDAQNNIYGATQAGGTKGAGTLYELVAPANPNGAYKEHVFFNFDGENGAEPKSSLVQDSLGYLYGTTYLGGANGDGAVFQANAHAGVTKTTLTASPNPSVQGQAVTFTATVTSSAGTPPPDGENVRFNGIGNAPLVNGVATFSTKRLPVGNTQTSATYGGDINFTSSNSAKLIQVVNQ